METILIVLRLTETDGLTIKTRTKRNWLGCAPSHGLKIAGKSIVWFLLLIMAHIGMEH